MGVWDAAEKVARADPETSPTAGCMMADCSIEGRAAASEVLLSSAAAVASCRCHVCTIQRHQHGLQASIRGDVEGS